MQLNGQTKRNIHTVVCLPCVESANAPGEVRKQCHIQIIIFFYPIEGKTVKTLKDLTEVSGSNLVQVRTID